MSRGEKRKRVYVADVNPRLSAHMPTAAYDGINRTGMGQVVAWIIQRKYSKYVQKVATTQGEEVLSLGYGAFYARFFQMFRKEADTSSECSSVTLTPPAAR